jgi:hypothetical protein
VKAIGPFVLRNHRSTSGSRSLQGNLKAEWFPRDGENGNFSQSDIPDFHRSPNRGYDITSRPSNELIFLHGTREVLYAFLENSDLGADALNPVLLSACGKVVERLKGRLSYHFDVRMLTDLFLKWEKISPTEDRWWSSDSRLLKWEIDDPRARKRAAEMLELEQLEPRHGFSEVALDQVQEALTAKAIVSGKDVSSATTPEKLAKELRTRGFARASKRSVERALSLIAKYRHPDQPSNVVPLRP